MAMDGNGTNSVVSKYKDWQFIKITNPTQRCLSQKHNYPQRFQKPPFVRFELRILALGEERALHVAQVLKEPWTPDFPSGSV